jgi:hypothetical protein
MPEENNIFSLENILAAAAENKAVDFENQFQGIMASKLQNVVNQKKIDIAQTMYADDNDQSEEPAMADDDAGTNEVENNRHTEE